MFFGKLMIQVFPSDDNMIENGDKNSHKTYGELKRNGNIVIHVKLFNWGC